MLLRLLHGYYGVTWNFAVSTASFPTVTPRVADGCSETTEVYSILGSDHQINNDTPGIKSVTYPVDGEFVGPFCCRGAHDSAVVFPNILGIIKYWNIVDGICVIS